MYFLILASIFLVLNHKRFNELNAVENHKFCIQKYYNK